jgi:hypothetical protein
MHEVCDRLAPHVVQAALVRYGFVDAGMARPEITDDNGLPTRFCI